MKRDLKKELRHLYAPSARVVQRVDVPTMRFLKIDGEGDPNTSQEYAEAVEALFALSYALKFRAKKSRSRSTTASCRSRACGGPMTCRRSPPAIARTGSGR